VVRLCGFFTWLMGWLGDQSGGLSRAFYLVPACFLTLVVLIGLDSVLAPRGAKGQGEAYFSASVKNGFSPRAPVNSVGAAPSAGGFHVHVSATSLPVTCTVSPSSDNFTPRPHRS